MRLAIVVFALLTTPLFAAYSTGFEPPAFVPGDVAGQNGWGHISNSPTGGRIESVPPASPAMFGTQSLALFTREEDFFGVSNHLFSPTIDPPAGENGSTVDGVVVPDPESHFRATLWYRAPSAPITSTRSGRIAELNPSSKGPDADDPANRYAQVRLMNDASGLLRVEIGWFTAGASGFTTAPIGLLQWGEWYRFEYLIELVDGLDGTAPNDRFTLTVFDAAGNQLGTACGSTWESAWKTGTFGGGATARAINGFDFWSNTGPDGTVVGHLDDLFFEAFTPAGGPLQVTIAGPANVCAGTTTTLTANASGGSGPVTGYTWRNASNVIVGTDPTLTAGAGTYTVTVTDGSCVSATSPPFALGEFPPVGVTITGASTFCCGQTSSTLTANVSGGSGAIASYTWRSTATNAVAGTNPTFDAPAGTYTVTITDSCGSATSAPFTVAQLGVESVPTTSEWALLMLAATLGMAAVIRMRSTF